MSPIYGNIDLINGQILNLRSETAYTDPEIINGDIGRIYFNTDELALKVNNGSAWLTLEFSNSSSSPLLNTLGNNWINSDLSFNPTPFNELPNISGLTSNDSLFTVISQLTTLIEDMGTESFTGLSDVTITNIQDGDLIFYNGTTFTNVSLTSLADERLAISTLTLTDVYSGNEYLPGNMLVFSTSENKFVGRPIFYQYVNTAADTEFAVDHNLGVKFCMVQCINYATNTVINNISSIIYTDENSLIVNLGQAAPVIILVSAVNST